MMRETRCGYGFALLGVSMHVNGLVDRACILEQTVAGVPGLQMWDVDADADAVGDVGGLRLVVCDVSMCCWMWCVCVCVRTTKSVEETDGSPRS